MPESTENPLYVCKDDAALRERAEKWEGRPQLWEWEKKSVEKEDVRAGTSVRVQVDYRKPQRRGSVGTIKKRYGTHHYTAFEVLFPDGQSELFWDHQLEEAKKLFSRPKRAWVFW